MASLGYSTETMASGAFQIRKEDGSAVDTSEFISFPTYHSKWKCDYPNLKVSRPVKDICNVCYPFAHRQKFFSDYMRRCGGYANDKDDDVDELVRLTRDININHPECASDKVAEKKEQMMLKGTETALSGQGRNERIRSRAYDTPSTLGETSRHRSISEYTCEKELGKKPDSIRLFNVDDHLTFIRSLYRKGLYEID
jgi:hypothetical protein